MGLKRSDILSLYKTMMNRYGFSTQGVLKYSTIRKMIMDDIISLAMRHISLVASNMNYNIIESKNPEIDSFLNDVLKENWNTFGEEFLYNNLSFGFASYEILFTEKNNYIFPTDYVLSTQESTKYQEDEENNYIGFSCSESSSEIIPNIKSIWLNHKGNIINPYGVSYLTPAFEPWYAMSNLELDMNKYFEKRATPPVTVEYPPAPTIMDGERGDLNQEKAEEIGATYDTNSVFVYQSSANGEPKWEIKEVPFSDRSASFETPLGHYQSSILRALGISDRLLINESTSGSYAEHRSKYIMFNQLVYGLFNETIKQLNNSFVKNIIDINFGEQDIYPIIELRKDDLSKELIYIDILMKLIDKDNTEILSGLDKNEILNILNLKKEEVI